MWQRSQIYRLHPDCQDLTSAHLQETKYEEQGRTVVKISGGLPCNLIALLKFTTGAYMYDETNYSGRGLRCRRQVEQRERIR